MENSHNISNLYSIIYLQILEKRHFGAKSLVKVAQSPYICHREKANIKYSQIIKPHTGAKTEMTNRKIDNHIKHYYQTTSNALLVTGARHHALLLQQQEAGGWDLAIELKSRLCPLR